LHLKGLPIGKLYFYYNPAQRNWMQPILLSYEAPFRSSLQKNRGMQRTGPNINFHFCYAQSSDKLNKKKSKWKHPASWHEMGLIFFDFHKAEYLEIHFDRTASNRTISFSQFSKNINPWDVFNFPDIMARMPTAHFDWTCNFFKTLSQLGSGFCLRTNIKIV